MVRIPSSVTQMPLVIERRQEPAYVCPLDETYEVPNLDLEEPWYKDIKGYLETGEYLSNATRKQQRALRGLASQYLLQGGELYKRNYNGLHLLCITQQVGKTIMEHVHDGVCGTHMNSRLLASKIIKLGYY